MIPTSSSGLPLVIGVVNVTPDSFSDGGEWFEPEAAVAHGRDEAHVRALFDELIDDLASDVAADGRYRRARPHELRSVPTNPATFMQTGKGI